jgi:cell division septation protein DedD
MAPPAPSVPLAPSGAKSEETQLAGAAAPLLDSHLSDPQEPQAETVSAAKPAVLRTALYSLQIGAFRKPENSSRIVQDLQSRGYDAYVVQEKGGRVILTVRVGRFAEREEALRAADEFRRREGKAVIVRTLSSYPATSW